jgi:hypothetical protein
LVDAETGEISEKSYRAKELENNDEFFEKLIKNADFKAYVEKKFKLTTISGIDRNIPESDDEDIDNDEDM